MPWQDIVEATLHVRAQAGIAAVRPSGSANVSRLQEETLNGQALRVRWFEQQVARGIDAAESTMQWQRPQQAAHHRCCRASGTGCSRGEYEDLSGYGRVQRPARQGGKVTGRKQKPPEQPVNVSDGHWLIRRRTCGHIWLTACHVKSFVPSE